MEAIYNILFYASLFLVIPYLILVGFLIVLAVQKALHYYDNDEDYRFHYPFGKEKQIQLNNNGAATTKKWTVKSKYDNIIVYVFLLLIIPIVIVTFYKLSEPKKNVQNETSQVTQQIVPPNREKLLQLVNEERAKAGASPLIIDERLNESAQMKADDMIANNYFGHVNPATGKHGYEYVPSGICRQSSENLITQLAAPKANEIAVLGWVNSKAHYEAMVNDKYKLTGFGISENKEKQSYDIVEHFCEIK